MEPHKAACIGPEAQHTSAAHLAQATIIIIIIILNDASQDQVLARCAE